MAIYSGTVTAATHDYWYINTTKQEGTNYLQAYENPAVGQGGNAYAELATNGLPPGVTITAATLWWWTDAYTKSKSTTFDGYVQMSSGGSYSSIYSFSTDPGDGVLQSHALTSGEFKTINLESGTTIVRFGVNDPGGSESRVWKLGAYESGTTFAVRVVVEYTEGGSPPPVRRGRAIVIG